LAGGGAASPTLLGLTSQEDTTAMRDLPICPRCHDNDWTVPAQLREPCYLRFDADDTADFADGPGPRVYLRHSGADFETSGQVFCTSCGWEPTPTDTKSLHVNEPLMRQRLVRETLDYEGTWPTVNDHPLDPPWPETYMPT
jgi:hypothetical protein